MNRELEKELASLGLKVVNLYVDLASPIRYIVLTGTLHFLPPYYRVEFHTGRAFVKKVKFLPKSVKRIDGNNIYLDIKYLIL